MKINWTDNILKDLKETKAYIARDSGFYATLFIEKLIAGVGHLSKFPKIGREVFLGSCFESVFLYDIIEYINKFAYSQKKNNERVFDMII